MWLLGRQSNLISRRNGQWTFPDLVHRRLPSLTWWWWQENLMKNHGIFFGVDRSVRIYFSTHCSFMINRSITVEWFSSHDMKQIEEQTAYLGSVCSEISGVTDIYRIYTSVTRDKANLVLKTGMTRDHARLITMKERQCRCTPRFQWVGYKIQQNSLAVGTSSKISFVYF